MPESKFFAMALIAAALLLPTAVDGGNISPLDQQATMAALMTKANGPPGAESLANRGERSGFGLSRPELLRLLAASGADSRNPGQSRIVQLILLMALATEGLPLLLRR
ncbi:MAG TPA: hypothetical protein VGC63_09895 [Solirubrobacterales bacterium]|jgi:hypothetical protein